MGKIKTILEKSAELTYVLIRAIARKHHPTPDGRILIMSGGHMGDALTGAQGIGALLEHYAREGKTVHFACASSLWAGYKMVLDLSKTVNTNNDYKGFLQFKSTIETLQKYSYDQVIIIQFRGGMLSLLACLSAKRKTIIKYQNFNNSIGEKVRDIAMNMLADEVIEYPYDMKERQRVQEWVKRLGAESYRTGISYIDKQCDYQCPFINYITISVDSSCMSRRWPTKKFIALIKRILDRFDHDVILTGSNLPEEQIRSFEEAFRDCERVKNMVGKMSLQEWVELLRGAKFHIGVDSGSIHVAASVGTQAFCLAGQWDGARIFPYEIEEQTENTVDPICIYRSDVEPDRLACRYCAAKREYGWGDEECLARCRAGEPCLCLERIEVEDVMRAIEQAREAGVIA